MASYIKFNDTDSIVQIKDWIEWNLCLLLQTIMEQLHSRNYFLFSFCEIWNFSSLNSATWPYKFFNKKTSVDKMRNKMYPSTWLAKNCLSKREKYCSLFMVCSLKQKFVIFGYVIHGYRTCFIHYWFFKSSFGCTVE